MGSVAAARRTYRATAVEGEEQHRAGEVVGLANSTERERRLCLHAVTERTPLLHGGDHLDLDHRLGLGEAADLDRRAGRTAHSEIPHAHVRALRERL